MWFMYAVSSAILFGLTGFFMKISQMRRGSTPHLLLGLYAAGTLGFAVNSALEGSLRPALGDWRLWVAGAVIGAGSVLVFKERPTRLQKLAFLLLFYLIDSGQTVR